MGKQRLSRAGIVQRIADEEVRSTIAHDQDPHDEAEIAGMQNTAWQNINTALGERPGMDEVAAAIENALVKLKNGTLGDPR